MAQVIANMNKLYNIFPNFNDARKETKILTYQANKGFCSVILLSIIGAAVASVGNVKGVGALPAWSFIFSAGFNGGCDLQTESLGCFLWDCSTGLVGLKAKF